MSSVPDFSTLAEAVFNSYPEDAKTLNAWCDQTEADRAQFGEDDVRVQAGEGRVNSLKGLFLRRIAWAGFQQDARFGLRKKTTGQIATRPADGATHSTDALIMQDTGQIIDALTDRKPIWSVKDGDTQPVSDWLKPLPPEGEPVPAPVPVPIPTPTPDPAPAPAPELDLAGVIKLLQDVAANQLALGMQFDALTKAIEEKPIPTVPPIMFPTYSGKIPYLGNVTLTPGAK